MLKGYQFIRNYQSVLVKRDINEVRKHVVNILNKKIVFFN